MSWVLNSVLFGVGVGMIAYAFPEVGRYIKGMGLMRICAASAGIGLLAAAAVFR